MWEEYSGIAPLIKRLLHVVARTRKAPYTYYYRRRETTGTWSAWEPLDVGIDAEHIMPAIWNRRMYMLWPEFTEKSLPTTAGDRTIPASTTGWTAVEPTKYWEIALAWTEKRGDLWMPKRLSQRKQLVAQNGILPKRVFLFRVSTAGHSLAIELYQPSVFTSIPSPLRAQWLLSSAQDEPVLSNADRTSLMALDELRYIGPVTGGNPKMGDLPKLGIKPLSFHFNAYGGDNPGALGALSLNKLELLAGTVVLQSRTMLGQISQPRVVAVRHGDLDQFNSSFSISDLQRTFLILDGHWQVTTFYHPFAETFVQTLNAGGVDALYDRLLQTNPEQVRDPGIYVGGVLYPPPPFDFVATYQPTSFVATPYPVETIDYSPSGAYAAYNWELFLHVPLLIAKRLADNQRFDEALRCKRWVDPT